MTTEPKSNEQETRKPKVMYRGGASDAVYGFGLIGAWVYYLSHAATFWLGVLGIFKGIILARHASVRIVEISQYVTPRPHGQHPEGSRNGL